MKRTPPPPRKVELTRRAPLDRSGALRRVALVRATTATVVAPQRKRRERGEFSPRARLLMWLRFDGLCCACWRPLPRRGWTAQHRRGRAAGGTSDPAAGSVCNGVAVHELPCHRRIEENPTWALGMGLRVAQYADPAGSPLQLPDGRRIRLTADGGYAAVLSGDGGSG